MDVAFLQGRGDNNERTCPPRLDMLTQTIKALDSIATSSSPITVTINFEGPSDQDGTTVTDAIFQWIRRNNSHPFHHRFSFKFGRDGIEVARELLGNVLTLASVKEVWFTDSRALSFATVPQLFCNDFGLKALAFGRVNLVGDEDEHLYQTLSNHASQNTTLEQLMMISSHARLITTVLKSISEKSKLKELIIKHPSGCNITHGLINTLVRGVLKRSKLKHLSLREFDFSDADSFRPIAEGIHDCPTLNKLTLCVGCKLGPESAEMLKELPIAMLGFGCVQLSKVVDTRALFRSVLHSASPFKKLSLRRDTALHHVQLCLQLLEVSAFDRLKIDIDESNQRFYEYVDHLPTIKIKRLVLRFQVPGLQSAGFPMKQSSSLSSR